MDSSCSTGFPRGTSVSKQNPKQKRCASRDRQQEAYTVRVQLLLVDRTRHPVLGCVACAQAKLRARTVDPGAGYESTRVAQYMSDYITKGKAQRRCTVQNNGSTVSGTLDGTRAWGTGSDDGLTMPDRGTVLTCGVESCAPAHDRGRALTVRICVVSASGIRIVVWSAGGGRRCVACLQSTAQHKVVGGLRRPWRFDRGLALAARYRDPIVQGGGHQRLLLCKCTCFVVAVKACVARRRNGRFGIGVVRLWVRGRRLRGCTSSAWVPYLRPRSTCYGVRRH